MKKIACLLLLLASNASADRLYYSHDLLVNLHADYIGGAYPKYKIAWGDDGTANDISLANPLPVQFSGSVLVVQGTNPWLVFDQTLDNDLISFRTANHTDLTLIDTDLLSFKTANHTDLSTVNTNLGTINTSVGSFATQNHSDLTLIDSDLLSFKSANHTDLGTLNTSVGTVNTSVNSFATTNHSDLGTLNTSVGTLNTNLLAFKSANHTDLALIDTDLLSFKSSNHTDLVQVDTDLLAFKSANHTDLGTINTSIGTGNSSLSSIDGKLTTTNSSLSTISTNTGNTATSAASIDTKLSTTNSSLSTIATNTGTTATNTGTIVTNQTSGGQKSQQVDASGNIAPVGDVVGRSPFVKVTDGTSTQAVKAASTAPVATDQAAVVALSPNGNQSTAVNQSTEITALGTINTTLGTTLPRNLAQVNGVTVSTNTGASGTGTQRVTLAADGQKTMANSTSVTLASDQTGINTFQDKSGSGTITALNGVVTATTNGMSTVSFAVTGTWTATIFFKGVRQDGSTEYLYANQIQFGSDLSFQNYSNNGTYVVNCAGFSTVSLKAEAFTSGTINVGWNASAGVNLVKIYQPTATNLQMTANAGTNLNTSALALSANQTNGTQKSQTVDGSGNVITSTTISGTAANKQPQDVNPLSTGTARYFTSFSTQQTAATATNTSVFTMRNAAASTKTVIIENINCRMGFNAANPITRTQQSYIFQRFTTATPTGGTALTAGLGDSSDSASQVSDIRFLDTGLTVTSVVFSGNNLSTMACDTTEGIACDRNLLSQPSAWKFSPGEGLAIRLGVVAVVGQSVSCNIDWREQ